MAAHLQAPIEFLPFIQAGSLRLFDARAEADAQRRARLLGVDPLVALPEALRQAADLIKREGWAITPQLLLCPISGFPLLRSPSGEQTWSVRAQMSIVTAASFAQSNDHRAKAGAAAAGAVRGASKRHGGVNTPPRPPRSMAQAQQEAQQQQQQRSKTTEIPLPAADSISEKVVASKARAVHLGAPLMSVKAALAEIARRLQDGWRVLPDTCPVTGFPLLLSPVGAVGADIIPIVWSVRCKCQVITQDAAEARNIWESTTAAAFAVSSPGRGGGDGGGDGGVGARTPPRFRRGALKGGGGGTRKMMVRGGGQRSSSDGAAEAFGALASTVAVLHAKMEDAKNRLAQTSLEDVDACCKLAEFIAICGKALSSLA
jgi:hypothetical protein